MPGIEIRSTGPLLDGRYKRVVPAELRRWSRGTLGAGRDYARRIAPVDTGTFRASIRVRTSAKGWSVRGDLFSTDIPGKVHVIEAGYDPAGPRGHYRRRGVYVFRRTYDYLRGLVSTQARVLGANLATALTKGRASGRYGVR